ncbi:unannotated protein [freshwater metagenome]|uniref:Unannotated protein n=1 Tax=freshwater metagenome TaxID=449393 RepID=A0A6J7F2D0_9ZZZZ|nr:hypothetical protein [Actinomycetota bacterium]
MSLLRLLGHTNVPADPDDSPSGDAGAVTANAHVDLDITAPYPRPQAFTDAPAIDPTDDGSVVAVRGDATPGVFAAPPSPQAEAGGRSDLAREHDALCAELEIAHTALASLAGELRDARDGLVATKASLSTSNAKQQRVELDIDGRQREAAALQADVVARSTQVASLADQADALRREIDYLNAHRKTVSNDLSVERATLTTTRDEVMTQLAKAEQLRSAATRSEIDASLHRIAADESLRVAEAARTQHAETVTAISTSRAMLTALASQAEAQTAEITRLGRQRSEAAIELGLFEDSLRARVVPLEAQIEELHRQHHETLEGLRWATAERTAVQEQLDHLIGTEDEVRLQGARIARDHLAGEISSLTVDRDDAERQRDAARVELRQLRASAEEILLRRMELGVVCDQLTASAAELHVQVADKDAQLQGLVNTIQAVRRECDELAARRQAADAALATAHEQFVTVCEQAAHEQKRAARRWESIDREVAKRVADELEELRTMSRWRRPRARRAARRAGEAAR